MSYNEDEPEAVLKKQQRTAEVEWWDHGGADKTTDRDDEYDDHKDVTDG